MKASTLVLVAIHYLGLASAASIASPDGIVENLEIRKCFATGEKYGIEKGEAFAAARQACNGPLKGTYSKRETRVRCYNIGRNKQVKLTVGLTGKNAGSTRTIGSDECYNGLSKEISNCEKGGDTTYGNWRYRADPNNGLC
ncbi:unnamed protein product [Clonostachys rosea]|uniref:Glycan binding protein Y3-like domain-containing protein n=1 Tax=Bionectria ochroleuca TaxID=29856 RepID=A0ABY6TRI7_BIOOC|nr:unnamed protein product [Clonostachys rosea]